MVGNLEINKHITKKYFDEIAAQYSLNEKCNSDKYEVIKELMLPGNSSPKILECGGGGGFYTRRFLQDGYRVTCIDLSAEALTVNREIAQKMGKQDSLRTIEGDFATVAKTFESQFDQIVFIKVLHHFDSLEEICYAINLARNICKENGRIIIFEPNGINVLWEINYRFRKDPNSGRNKWFYEQNTKLVTENNFKKCLRGANYVVDYHYLIPSFVLNKPIMGVSILKKINGALIKTFLKRFAFNISIVVNT